MVAFNNDETASSQATVPTYYAGGVQFDLIFAEGNNPAASLTTDANGDLALEVPALGFVIYKASAPSNTETSIQISNLQNARGDLAGQEMDGHEVTDRVRWLQSSARMFSRKLPLP
jgi:hypothetical protein